MKALKIFAFAAVAAVMAVSCGRSEVKVDVELPTTAEIDSVSYLLGVNYGIMFKQQGFAEKLSDIDMAAMKKGMEDALKADETFSLLMGEKVEPRRNFIQENAKYVKNIDI